MFKISKTRAVLIFIPLILSAFTHLYNPAGFPCVNFDEAVGIRRALHFLVGLGPQDPSSRFDHSQASASSYDHPHFGQIFLGAMFKIIGYPSSLNPSSSLESIEMLYVVPRVIMGLLAVLDTFLIYKIVERRYNTKTGAFIASILFAVMPMTWLYRWILLDSILMPFALSSILFAIYLARRKKDVIASDDIDNSDVSSGVKKLSIKNALDKNKEIILTLVSGILLGLAIYTKVPAITIIPVVGFLVFTNTRKWKLLGLWLIPVVFIPLLWPAYALSVGQFDEWLQGVFWQATEREITPGTDSSHTISSELKTIFYMDPILLSLSLAGFVYAAIRRNYFILLWIVPFFIFTFIIHWVYYFHFILLLPVFCIASGLLIKEIPDIVIKKDTLYKKLAPFAAISIIGILGLTTTIFLIESNYSLPYFAVSSFIAQHSRDNIEAGSSNGTNTSSFDDITIISSPAFSWIFSYVFHINHVLPTRASQELTTEKVLLVLDPNYRFVISGREVEDEAQVASLLHLYNNTATIASFQYPDSILKGNPLKTNIKSCYFDQLQVRTNY